jgi:Ca2+-binding RTX toxin-like protein
MSLQVLDFRYYAAGDVLILGTTDSLLIARNGISLSTDGGSAVFGIGSYHWVMVEGVAAGGNGIELGNDGSLDFRESVRVSETGVVAGTTNGILLAAFNSNVVNDGLIDGVLRGIYFFGQSSGVSRLENRGTIQAENDAVYSFGTERLSILNTGTISGFSSAIVASALNDTVRNSELIFGNVRLWDGNDSYDGRGGSIEGTIYGGGGDDTFRVGDGIEVIDGGDGNDTLNFTTGGAINVALDGSFANTGTATDDQYLNIEVVTGSRFGDDSLAGDNGYNQLFGQGGNDTLMGRDGVDVLIGGQGGDRMVGGAGSDEFTYNDTTEGGDRITDYGNVAGNDDTFVFRAAGFGGGLSAGSLAAAQFQSRADNVAQDADDRFIFNTATQTLWFDVNGNVAGGLTLIATVQAGVVLTAGDIFML